MSDLYILIVGTIVFILVNITLLFLPNAWEQALEAFTIKHWYVGPIVLLFGIFGFPLILIWNRSRKSGVPFRIVAQSYIEYVFGDELTRRLSTIKLVITEKELEENK